MTNRPLPDFLKHGDKPLGLPRETLEARMRRQLGMPPREIVDPPFIRNGN